MAELSIVTMQQCSNSLRHCEVGGYQQTVAYSERDQNHCTCKGYQFSKQPKHCKHIAEAMEQLCNYHEQMSGPPKVDGVCPECGEPTEYVRVGV